VITEVPGVRVGHWTNPEALTGCTVVLLPAGTVASGECRGGAPGTREWALLEPGRTVDRVNALVMTGGSAFGLSACDGVARWCEERGVGYPTPTGPVPIVVGMVIYDLAVGDPSVRPGADDGYSACVGASATGVCSGRVGVGAGATIGKWRGPEASPGTAAGLGSAVACDGDLIVASLMVVNAVGEPRPPEGLDAPRIPYVPLAPDAGVAGVTGETEATTVGVVVTNAALDKTSCWRVAQSGHDGLARSLDPVHTAGDGDAIVVAATGPVDAPVEVVRALAAWVVERAVLDAARGA
jgi:L-aminopeptidase/D-esterase-like protein